MSGTVIRGRSAAGWVVAWAVVALGLLAGGGAGCRDRQATLQVNVKSSSDTLPALARIVVAASNGTRRVSISASGTSAAPLALPVSVELNISGFPVGDTLVEAMAFDTSQTLVAQGSSAVTIPTFGVITVALNCLSPSCALPGTEGGVDAGTDGADDDGTNADAIVSSKCGNGRIDPGETCDIALPPEFPGACPGSCDDGIPCTQDQRMGTLCTAWCEHHEITDDIPGDGCCPARADHGVDTDCSASCGDGRIDPGEACDTAILSGPGACPDDSACDDHDPCTVDLLVSDSTCSARCAHTPILLATADDGCCPQAADATLDDDCPAACGNGVLELGERCDTGIGSGTGACPTVTTCDDRDPCTRDVLSGSDCQTACTHTRIDTAVAGDGCCPSPGLNKNADSDCAATCGNGILESGETCDNALPSSAPGGCPLACPQPAVACTRYLMQGSADKCSAVCVAAPVSVCSPTSDGCCPRGCTHAVDPDCSPTCGNGKVDPGETCDTAIPSGTGACPRACGDGVPCTDDILVDADTCNARCAVIATTTFRTGDGCCPPGGYGGIDADCPATCGNGVVEPPWETCDTASSPATCSMGCPPPETCATWTQTATNDCNARCVRVPITACADADGCCPPGCHAANDSDCVPRCGDGLVEAPETCDRGITAGHPGACLASCSDNEPCTLDFAHGSAESCTRVCSHVVITACGGGDRCCPAGCDGKTDSDCAPSCGDGQVQAHETCDPASTCPTTCPSDGDPCTVDQLDGSAATCSAACAYVPILRCSGAQRDGCCPTECSALTDSDC